MEKTITITEENGMTSFKATGFSAMEVIGLLRFYEKDVWLKMQQTIEEKQKKTKKPKTKSEE